jgi:hypothetical protein
MVVSEGFRLSAFGLEVESDVRLPGMRPTESGASPADLSLTLVTQEELLPFCTEQRVLRVLQAFDGCPYAMLEGADGDTLMCYGHRALFHLSANRRLLRCAPAVQGDPHWQRVLLDTVLWTVSALEGFLLLHASAVETVRGVVAFVATSGGGKSSLAAEYVRRGGSLFSDDVVAVADRDGQLTAFPGPPLMNLPRELDPAVAGEAIALAEFGDEHWVELLTTPPEPQPLAAVVLLERAPGRETDCVPIDCTPITLLPQTFGFSHSPEQARARFDLAGRLAATTRLLSLTADPSVPSETLADLIDGRLDPA